MSTPQSHLPQSFDFPKGHQCHNSLSTLSDMDVWWEYATGPESIREPALTELFYRHNAMLAKLAWRFAIRNAHIGEFDDWLQHARIGAIQAYNRFNPYKEVARSAKLATFVHRTTENSLKSAVDADAPVHCPTHRRGMRSYLSGRYDNDPDKKRTFEQENGLITMDKISEAQDTFKLLVNLELLSLDMLYLYEGRDQDSDPTSMHDILPAYDICDEDQLIDHVDLMLARGSLSDRHRTVFDLIFAQQYTIHETASTMDLTTGQVRSDIRAIRRILQARKEGLGAAEF